MRPSLSCTVSSARRLRDGGGGGGRGEGGGATRACGRRRKTEGASFIRPSIPGDSISQLHPLERSSGEERVRESLQREQDEELRREASSDVEAVVPPLAVEWPAFRISTNRTTSLASQPVPLPPLVNPHPLNPWPCPSLWLYSSPSSPPLPPLLLPLHPSWRSPLPRPHTQQSPPSPSRAQCPPS